MNKHIYIFFLICIVFSCKEVKNKKGFVESPKVTEDKSFDLPNKSALSKDSFSKVLLKQPIAPLPFSFAGFLVDSLNNRSAFSEVLQKHIQEKIDTFSVVNKLNDQLNYFTTIKNIHEDTESYQTNYYYFLLNYGGESKLSKAILFKRLPRLKNNIEVLLASSQIQEFENDFIKGINIELITYDTNNSKILNKKRIITAGVGIEDIWYREGFVINKDYTIKIKSYTGIEGESTSIKRELKVMPDGKIVEQKKPIVLVEYSEENYE